MPLSRPSLTELRAQVAQDIASALPGSDPLLRFSNLGILGTSLAGLAHLHYGYLDWIAQQAVPFTCSGEFLEAWAALKGVLRIPAAQASGTVTFSGATGTVLPAGTPLARGDGVKYRTTASATIGISTLTVAATADADPAGQIGANGNCPPGTSFALGTAIAGINGSGSAATAFTGGADIETDDALRSRMLLAFRTRAHGGSAADFLSWTREVAGVTRAWCVPHGYGAGTVLVYFMLDSVQAAHGGFPQGTDGVATSESRAAAATGDQLAVANHLFPLQPIPTLVYAQAPTPNVVPFTIGGLATAGATVKNAVAAAIQGALRQYGSVSGSPTTVPLSLIEAAIVVVPGTTGFLVTTPGDIVSPAGSLPVLGTITWA